MRFCFLPLVVSSLLFVPVSNASEDPVSTACQEVAQSAREVMTYRQDGVPMQEMMKVAGDVPDRKLMVEKAYDVPRQSSEAVQQGVIEGYAGEWFRACVKSHQQ